MPSIGPLEMILVLLYDVVALSVLALFVYASSSCDAIPALRSPAADRDRNMDTARLAANAHGLA